jgi:hypothetical protein
MGTTLQDMISDRDRMLHEIALWTELKEHLAKFLDGDSTPAKLGISSKGGIGVVPQDIIMDAQFQMEATVEQLQQEISTLETTEVAKNESTPEEKREGESKTAGAPGKKGRKVSKPAGGTERPPK